MKLLTGKEGAYHEKDRRNGGQRKKKKKYRIGAGLWGIRGSNSTSRRLKNRLTMSLKVTMM